MTKQCQSMQYNAGTKVHTAYWNMLLKQYMIEDKCSQSVLDKNQHLITKSLEEITNEYLLLHEQWLQRKKKKANVQ